MSITDDNGDVVIYVGDDGKPTIEVTFQGETAWLTQAQLAELFQTTRENITQHIKNILAEGELQENSVCKNFLRTAADGKRYQTKYYDLDMIISLGYRVKSKVATQFRIWATERLREYIVKGFTMNDDQLKGSGGGVYWKELLDRIRDIRSSEKVLYRQALDLYATSVDYDPHSDASKQFFAIMQNKLHYAANGKTASQMIIERADANEPFMGLMTFGKNGVCKADVTIAKNYLKEDEIKRLNNVVSAYFDIAELRALDHKLTYMKDYIDQLDKLIASMDRAVLQNAGTISHIEAEAKARTEYTKYRQKIVTDITPVEKAYLDTIKNVQKKIKGKAK